MRRVLLFLILAASRLVAQPTITNVYVAAQSATTATIVWTTNTPATSQVVYGLNTGGYMPFSTPVNSALTTSHSMTMIVLLPGQTYNIAAVSTNGGGRTQSSEANFTMCGGGSKPMIPATGTATNYYEYGSFTMTWTPPAGSSGAPKVCGESFDTTVTGTLSGGASLSASVADALKAVPGPGTWTTVVSDAGSLAPLTVAAQLSAQNQDISAQLQQQAATSGLMGVLANTTNSTCFPAFVCAGGGGSAPAPPEFAVQLAGPGATALAADPNILINTTLHRITAPQVSVSSLTQGNCVIAGTGGSLTDTGQPCGTGSGTISGQTINFLLRATSATASTTSSLFGEDTVNNIGTYTGSFFTSPAATHPCVNGACVDFGGVIALGGGQGALSPQCFFSQGTGLNQNCGEVSYVALGASAVGNTFTDRNSQIWHTTSFIATPGIYQQFTINKYRAAIHDDRDISIDSSTEAGCALISQECDEYFFMHEGEPFGYMHATVSSVSGDRLILTGQNGCTGDDTPYQGCNAITGSSVIDTSASTYSGKMTGQQLWTYGTQGDLTAWSINTPTTASTAWGYANGTTGSPVWADTLTPADTPVQRTFTLNMSLTLSATAHNSPNFFAVNDVVCYVTNTPAAESRQTIITAVGTPSGSTQSITMGVVGEGVNVVVMRGGPCGNAASFDNQLAYTGYREVFPVIGSVTGNELIYAAIQFGTLTPLPFPVNTIQAVTVDGGDDSGVTLYCGAYVTAQRGTVTAGQPFPDGNPSVETNHCSWSGHTVEGPPYWSQLHKPMAIQINSNMPGSAAGATFDYMGAGVAGNAMIGMTVHNDNDYSTYAQGGGDAHVHLPLAGYISLGGWEIAYGSQYLPPVADGGGLLVANGYAPGNTSGRLLSSPGGTLDVSTSGGTNTWELSLADMTIPNGGIRVQNIAESGEVLVDNGNAGVNVNTSGFGPASSISLSAFNCPNGTCNALDLVGAKNVTTMIGPYAGILPGQGAPTVLELTGPFGVSLQQAGTEYASLSSASLAVKSGTNLTVGLTTSNACTDCQAFFSGNTEHNAELHSTSTTSDRTAFLLSGDPGGTSTPFWEFGVGVGEDLVPDYYIYNYGTSSLALDISPTTNAVTLPSLASGAKTLICATTTGELSIASCPSGGGGFGGSVMVGFIPIGVTTTTTLGTSPLDYAITTAGVVTSSKPFAVNDGTSNSGIVLHGDVGLFENGAGVLNIGNGTPGDFSARINATVFNAPSTGLVTWNSDTGISRDSAGAVDCGNGTLGDKSCTFNAAVLKASSLTPNDFVVAGSGGQLVSNGHIADNGTEIQTGLPFVANSLSGTNSVELGGFPAGLNSLLSISVASSVSTFYSSGASASTIGTYTFNGYTPTGPVTDTFLTLTTAAATFDHPVVDTRTGGPGFAANLFTPASSSAACTTGQISWDAGFIYVCTSTNTWQRVVLTIF